MHKPTPPIQVPLLEHGDFVAAENITADRPLPAMNRVMMDGVALSQESYANGNRRFKVVGCQHAGEAPLRLANPEDCIEIMTGAMLPDGCTAVVRYEDLDMDSGFATIHSGVTVPSFGNIHRRGSDAAAGTVLVPPGTRMSAAEWAVAASVGREQTSVYAKPRIAVLTSGSEVLPVSSTPEEYQLRGSNAWAVKAALGHFGFPVSKSVHAGDDAKSISASLESLLSDHDVVITTGGVSKGKHDFLPEVLADLKVRRVFHHVSQRPGKPLWFGKSDRGTMVFGLPGNPVSVLVGLRVYVVPTLMAMSGRTARQQFARLAETITFKPDLTLFQPVRIEFSQDGVLKAWPVSHNTSGDFAGLVGTDGIIELPQGRDLFKAGQAFEFFAWSPSL